MSGPLNSEPPPQVPVRPTGDVIHVIARLVYSDHEEWRPAKTCRWTDQHVLVQWWPDDGTETLCWLAAGDVRRVVVTPRDGVAATP